MPGMKGQEVRVDIISATQGLEPGLSGVVTSFEHQTDIDGLAEGYIGALNDVHDNIFNGVSGSVETHLRSVDAFSFQDRVVRAAQNRTPGEIFTIVATFTFPVGGTRRRTFPDVKIANIKIANTSRKDYVKLSFDWAADDYQTLASPA